MNSKMCWWWICILLKAFTIYLSFFTVIIVMYVAYKLCFFISASRLSIQIKMSGIHRKHVIVALISKWSDSTLRKSQLLLFRCQFPGTEGLSRTLSHTTKHRYLSSVSIIQPLWIWRCYIGCRISRHPTEWIWPGVLHTRKNRHMAEVLLAEFQRFVSGQPSLVIRIASSTNMKALPALHKHLIPIVVIFSVLIDLIFGCLDRFAICTPKLKICLEKLAIILVSSLCSCPVTH
jgi:hypothetical protein